MKFFPMAAPFKVGNSKDLFISYSSKDRTFVTRLATDLIGHGLTVWIDKFEMKVGDSLNGKIQAGIRHCEFSPNSCR